MNNNSSLHVKLLEDFNKTKVELGDFVIFWSCWDTSKALRYIYLFLHAATLELSQIRAQFGINFLIAQKFFYL